MKAELEHLGMYSELSIIQNILVFKCTLHNFISVLYIRTQNSCYILQSATYRCSYGANNSGVALQLAHLPIHLLLEKRSPPFTYFSHSQGIWIWHGTEASNHNLVYITAWRFLTHRDRERECFKLYLYFSF
jgi:hypothetical protein